MAEDVGESLKLNIKITSVGEDKLSKITQDVKSLSSVLNVAVTPIQQVQKSFKNIETIKTSSITNAKNEISKTANECSKAAQQMKNFVSSARGLNSISEAKNAAFSAMVSSGLNTDTLGFERIFSEVEKSLDTVGNSQAIISLSAQLRQGVITASEFESYIKSLGITTTKTANQTRKASEALEELGETEKSVSGVSKSFSSLKEAAAKAVAPLKKVIKTIGRVVLYRAIRAALNAITQGMKTGIQNIARYSSEANATMSELATTSLYVKNSLGAAAMPIIKQVTPMLVSLAQYAVKALNAINMLVSVLQGKNTFTKAKEYAVDYASSLGNSATSASKSVEKLKRDLMGFDELNILSAPETDTASGTGGEDYSAMFEVAPVTEEVKKISEYLDVALATINGIGAGIAAWKLSNFIFGLDESISKAELLKKSLSFAAGVTLTIAGITLIIESISDIITDGISPEEFAEMVTGSALITVGGALIGKALGDTILGAAVGGIVGGAAMMVTGVVSALKDGLDEENSAMIMLGSTVTGAFIGSFFGPMGTLIGGLIGLVVGFFVDLGIAIAQHWDEFTAMLSEFVDKIKELPSEMAKEISNVATHIKEGFLEAWGGEGTLWEKISASFTAIIDGIKEFFGIASPSKVMKEIGSYIVDGFTNGIKENWDALTSKVSNLLSELKQKFSNKVDEILGVFKNWWNNLKNWWGSLSLGSLKIKLPHFEWTTQPAEGWIAKVLSAINLPTSLPKLNVKWYSGGGFPEDGLFMANHSELVGKFSNGKTAVANNQQIQAGIEEAAYRGFIRAFSQTNGMGNQGGTYKFVAQLNGKTLFEEVVEQNNSTVKSTGATPLLV